MPDDSDNEIRYGGAVVKLYTRGDGKVALSWSEGGKPCRTTRTHLDQAIAWARKKVRELDKASGARWVTPASADRLAWMEEICGGPEATGRVLTLLERTKELLGDLGEIEAAAKWYVKHGPPAVQHRTLKQAVEGFIAEYERHHPSTTYRPVRSELRALTSTHGETELLKITHDILAAHVWRQTEEGNPPVKRTVKNRLASWTTFFNRCEALEWWPEGKKHPSAKVKRPAKEEDKAPDIFSVEQGAALLEFVSAKLPQHLPFLVIAGWLGCRPSECQRLRKDDFDFENALLHVRAEVALKTARERWIPLRPAIIEILRPILEAKQHGRANSEKACRWNSREIISREARAAGIITEWPDDVLRHSRITYRLREISSIDQTAEESGNSPSEIRSSYRRPIPPGVAEKWFALLDLYAPTSAQPRKTKRQSEKAPAPAPGRTADR